jgi:hypothetical protein
LPSNHWVGDPHWDEIDERKIERQTEIYLKDLLWELYTEFENLTHIYATKPGNSDYHKGLEQAYDNATEMLKEVINSLKEK